ncbi:hypothetical protein DAI22_05g066401 [Oryza sativa Japonica Group]|nr:hypothetical protein DAI22_05g066401 [Oryza sativa Japonica Group]
MVVGDLMQGYRYSKTSSIGIILYKKMSRRSRSYCNQSTTCNIILMCKIFIMHHNLHISALSDYLYKMRCKMSQTHC